MTAADGVELRLEVSDEAGTPFEAGQRIAQAVLLESVEQLGPEDAQRLMLGMFSGAMAALQSMMGTPAVRDLFTKMADADTGRRQGVH